MTEMQKHIETLNWLAGQYLPGGPRDVKGAIRAAVAALSQPEPRQPDERSPKPVAWLYETYSGEAFVSTHRRTHWDGHQLTGETPLYAQPTSEPLSDAVGRAILWLKECSDWLLSSDLDMQCPMEDDPLDIVDALSALPASSGEVGRVVAWLREGGPIGDDFIDVPMRECVKMADAIKRGDHRGTDGSEEG